MRKSEIPLYYNAFPVKSISISQAKQKKPWINDDMKKSSTQAHGLFILQKTSSQLKDRYLKLEIDIRVY